MEIIKSQVNQMLKPLGAAPEHIEEMTQAALEAAKEKGKLWDFDDDNYFAFPAINASSLADIRKSPAHYYHNQILKNADYSSKAMDFGSLVHTAILEPSKIHERFVNDQEFIEAVYAEKPDSKKPRATALYKSLVQEAQEKGQTIITDEQFQKMHRIVEKVYNHPIAKNMLNAGHAEKILFAEDPQTGLLLKAKADFILSDGFIIDVKTTRDAAPRDFQRSFYNYNYYVQAAFYNHVASNSIGPAFKNFLFLCIENEGPEEIAIYKPDDGAVDAGYCMMRRDLDRLSQCFKSGNWPGYPTQIQSLALPPYAYNQIDELMDQ